jgi:TonB family protein
MRVLVVDQDSASNLAITRSLRDLYTVDCVSNKGDCLDLLRANTYEVIVATERLEDGSGLELLGTISKKWPSVLRIFAAERQRLQLLRGRLGPFELFQTLTYPIDPQKLLATLEMAAAARHGEEQQIELTDEAPPEPEAEAAGQADDSMELEQSDEFEEPRFARAGRAAAGPGQVSSVSQRPSSGRGSPPPQTRPAASSQRARSVSAAAPAADSVRGARGRRTAEPNRANELAAKFPGSGTIGPRRTPGAGSPSGSSGESAGRPARSARPRSAAGKPPPVRFPPLERTPPLERIPPLEPPSARIPGGEFSEAAAMARAARSNYEASSDELDTKRLATLIGGGVAVVAVVVFLAFKMFGSKSEAPKPAPPVVAHAPEYPPEVTGLIAQIEAAFKADDFKTARSDVDKLRQLSPSHPRLDFFDGLLTAKSSATANGRGAAKKNGKSGSSAGTSRPSHGGSEPSSTAASSSHAASVLADVTASTPTTPSSASSASTADPSPTLPPETPAGITLANSAAPAPPAPAPAPATAPAAGVPVVAAAAPEPAPAAQPAAAEPARTPAQTPAASHRAGGEPPPVVQEAKLVRRVNPDYPSAAKKDGISGFVDLEVTVSKQGNVDDVSVTQSTPPNMFDKSAVAAVRKWKYDPRFVDGLPSTAHLKVHLEFGPNK